MASTHPVDLLLAVGSAAVLVLLAWIDLRTRRIPNLVVYPALLIAIVSSWAWTERGAADVALAGGCTFAVAAALRTLSRGGLGGGDVKMAALVGGVVGYPAVLTAGVVAACAGGLTALLFLVTRTATRDAALPYAPFLALGGMIALSR